MKAEKHEGSTWTTVDIGLGYHEEIAEIFDLGDTSMRLEDAITFIFSQTLERDLFYGSWAQAYKNGNGEYRIRVTSPRDDVRRYEKLIPGYIAAGQKALAAFSDKVTPAKREGWKFLLPFGLAMASVRSIQLLHFPPLETFTYRDYLYSPTNRRWECLLAQNGFDGSENTTLERIVDVEPIAAPGGAGTDLAEYNEDFVDYAIAQLRNFLRPVGTAAKVTQPVVAYGGPVHSWLSRAFYTERPKTRAEKYNNKVLDAFSKHVPGTLDVFELEILGDERGTKTWILCANHPSQYLYDTNIPIRDAEKPVGDYGAPIDVMVQDLVAAGWQAHMAEHPEADGREVLREMQAKWGCDPKTKKMKRADKEKVHLVEELMREQDMEFRLDHGNFVPTPAQTRAEHFFILRSKTKSDYAVFAFEPEKAHPFTAIQMARGATYDPSRRLTQVGGYLLDWGIAKEASSSSGAGPSKSASSSKAAGSLKSAMAKTKGPTGSAQEWIDYRLVQFNRDSADPLAERSAVSGTFEKSKFFGDYRPNFGASFEQLELVGLPGYVLSLIPATGRRTYQLWNFDPSSSSDCLSAGAFQQGGFRDITADRELHQVGNYVLDRKGGNFRVWSFDPQSSPPLAMPLVQEENIREVAAGDSLAVVGNWILVWNPKDPKGQGRLFEFDVNKPRPLGVRAVKTVKMPEGFTTDSYLVGVLPSAPHDKAKEDKPGSIEFMRREIKHVVYYMLESRSFDNVLGWLYKNGQKSGIHFIGGDTDGYRGLDPSMVNRLPDGKEARVSKYQGGKLSNAFVLGGPPQDPWHDNSDVLMQMFHGYEGYKKRQKPKMDGFAWNQDTPDVMSSFTPEQLTVMNGLAENFAVSDDWFGSVPGGTDVNRGFSVSGSAYNRLGTWEGGKAYQDWPDSPHRQSIWKVLWSHGQRDWKIYYNILWENAVFSYQLYLSGQIGEVDAAWNAAKAAASSSSLPNSQWIAPYSQFEQDVKYRKLPRFSYIEPAWVGAACTSYHPGSGPNGLASIVPGERALNQIYETLRSSKEIWENTLLVITFDKNGGLYDHVPPPYAQKPWPHDVCDGFEYDLMGPRVPAVMASPFIKPHTVLRAGKNAAFDSSSFAATLLDWYGIPRGNWGMGDRIIGVPTIEKVLSLKEARRDSPQLPNPYDANFPKK